MMIFALVFSLVPLTIAAGIVLPYAKDKVTYYPKPERWMLKPLSPGDEHHKPPPTKSTSVYEYTTWFITTYYSSEDYCDSGDVIMKTGVPAYQCLHYEDSTSGQYYCYSYNGYCLYQEYSDANCYTFSASYNVYLGICDSGSANDDGLVTDDGDIFLKKSFSAEYGYPVALPGNSTTFTMYDMAYCDQTTMNYYLLAYPDLCYNNFDGQNRTSTQYVNPFLNSYNDTGCAETNLTCSASYPPGQCQQDWNTYTSSMLVLNFPVVPTVPRNTAGIVAATIGGFAAVALLETMLLFFQPSQSQSDAAAAQAKKAGEF